MSVALTQARQRYAAALDEEQKILEALVTENRDASDEEKKKLDELAATRKRSQDLIDRLLANKAEGDKVPPLEDEQARAALPTPGKTKVSVGREEGEDENGKYRPFRNIGEQLQMIRSAAKQPYATDQRLVKMNQRAAAGASEGVGADGGFLLQDDFSATLMKIAFESGTIAPLCTRMPTSPGSTGIEFPVVEETSRVEGSRWGGVQVYRENEATAGTYKKPKFSLERLGFAKLMGLFAITDELAADATFLSAWMMNAFRDEIAVRVDNEIIRGTGVGQMKGILNSACLVSIAKETSQAADTIVGMNVVKMFARLFAAGQSRATWLANQNCFPQIATLTITKDKSDVPLYSPPNLVAGQTLGTLLGRPVRYVEQCSTVGDKGDLILGDFSRYIIIEKDVQEASSIHVYFDTDQTAYRVTVRNNGMPLLKQAVTPMNGTDTLTDFVVIDDRT